MLRRMRIVVGVGMLMMLAMRGDPEERSAFECESGAGGQEIFDDLRCFIRPMREQPVICHADAERQRNVIGDAEDREAGPRELKQGPYRADMKQRHEEGGRPRQLAVPPE